jgi:hypothetical protein
MLYELRTYWAAPGKSEAIHNRFRTLTMGIFKRLNMEVVGFWRPVEVIEESGDLVYVMRFENEAAQAAAWECFRADPEWIEGRTKSEVDGKLVIKVTSINMVSTDYAPKP